MSKPPRVSVVIPNHNYARYLPQSLESVLAQAYQNFEVLVVDDGSTDDSREVLRSYGARIRLIEQLNRGVAVARNRGVEESSGDFVAFLDADDIWLPDKLERQVQRFLEDPELGLVHCAVEEIDDAGTILRHKFEGMEGWVGKDLLLFKRPVILGGGSGLMVPRATFDRVGGFDVRLSTAADWDFFYQIAERQRVGFVREVLLRYRVHGTNMHTNIHAMEHDMMLAYAKAFNSASPEIQRINRQSYGNLHMVLAGSFFRSRQPYDFVRHALKSLQLTPGNVGRLLGFPVRRFSHRSTCK